MHDKPDAASGEPKAFPWKKVLLGCGCASIVLVALCAGGIWWFAANALIRDPVKVTATADSIIAGDTLPEGYKGAFAVDMFGFKMAMLSPGTFVEGQPLNAMAVMLMSLPTADTAQAQTQMEQSLNQQTGQDGTQREQLESETITVGGKEVELHKARVTGQGEPQLQCFLLLSSGGKSVMIMFIGPEATFDRDAMDAYLASIPSAGE